LRDVVRRQWTTLLHPPRTARASESWPPPQVNDSSAGRHPEFDLLVPTHDYAVHGNVLVPVGVTSLAWLASADEPGRFRRLPPQVIRRRRESAAGR
jgi:hypothetical protein